MYGYLFYYILSISQKISFSTILIPFQICEKLSGNFQDPVIYFFNLLHIWFDVILFLRNLGLFFFLVPFYVFIIYFYLNQSLFATRNSILLFQWSTFSSKFIKEIDFSEMNAKLWENVCKRLSFFYWKEEIWFQRTTNYLLNITERHQKKVT